MKPREELSSKVGTTASSDSGTRWATRSRTETVTGKKLLLIHHGNNVSRIAFTEKTSGEAIEKTIRRECGLNPEEPFSLIDRECDSVVIEGSMLEGELWLDSISNPATISSEKV